MEGLKIDRNEVLRYLGYNNQDINSDLDVLIDICRAETIEISRPRYIYEYFDIATSESGITLENTNLILKGEAIKNHLANSKYCVILAVTLGSEIEKKINLYNKVSITKALIMDACATTLIENICDTVNNIIINQSKEKQLYTTSRFSPGYGDLPLEQQGEILNVIEANKKIGINSSDKCILFPRKSVTAIIGIGEQISQLEKERCKGCNKYESCMFRRKDESCGNIRSIK